MPSDPKDRLGAGNYRSLHMPEDILLRKAREIASQELQVCDSSRKKLLSFRNFRHTSDDECRLVLTCSTSKGNYGVEQVDKRLMELEEETEAMKLAIMEAIEERKMLVNEIRERFRRIHLCCYCLGKQVNENGSLIVNSPSSKVMNAIEKQHAAAMVMKMKSGLSQVLIEDSNPCIVNRYHRAVSH